MCCEHCDCERRSSDATAVSAAGTDRRQAMWCRAAQQQISLSRSSLSARLRVHAYIGRAPDGRAPPHRGRAPRRGGARGAQPARAGAHRREGPPPRAACVALAPPHGRSRRRGARLRGDSGRKRIPRASCRTRCRRGAARRAACRGATERWRQLQGLELLEAPCSYFRAFASFSRAIFASWALVNTVDPRQTL